MLTEPLSTAEARKLLSYILLHGSVGFSDHARKEMEADGITDDDAFVVLKNGRIYEPAELQGKRRQTWRYRVHRDDLCLVVAFDSEALTMVVTAWRKTR